MISRTHLAPIALVVCSLALPAAAQNAGAPGAIVPQNGTASTEPLRYVRAKDGGAKLLNIQDKLNGLVLENVASKGVLAVWGEQAGYLNVSSPGGFPVWVFGEYLEPTSETGIAKVTGSNVLMRPMPSSDVSSYPLAMRLQVGDSVRVIGRSDAKKALAEDWVQVLAPETARGWVLASDVQPLDGTDDPKALWKAATKSEIDARPALALGTASKGDAKSSPGEIVKADKPAAKDAKKPDAAKKPDTAAKSDAKPADDVSAKLAAADKLFEAAKASQTPNFASAKAAYQKVIEGNAKGAAADTARARLDEINVREEIVAIRNDAKLIESQRSEKLDDAQKRLREASYSTDPMWGRFQTRGWLERVVEEGSAPRFVVRWADKVVAEVVCTNGRYDLGVFENFEVGVLGAVQRNAVAGGAPARIDASRLEVISGRAR